METSCAPEEDERGSIAYKIVGDLNYSEGLYEAALNMYYHTVALNPE